MAIKKKIVAIIAADEDDFVQSPAATAAAGAISPGRVAALSAFRAGAFAGLAYAAGIAAAAVFRAESAAGCVVC